MNYGKIDVVERSVRFQGFFSVEKYRLRHSLFGGGMSEVMSRELFQRGRAVAVLPFDPVLNRVVLIEQFRIGAIHDPQGAWLTEIVAGMISDGEAPEDVAHREAVEESGCEVTALLPICSYYPSPGACSETIKLYCGKVDAGIAGGVHGLDYEHEDIRVLTVGLDEALAWLETGRINSAAPIISLQWLAANKANVIGAWK